MEKKKWEEEPAAQAQLVILRRLGVRHAPQLTKLEAALLIDSHTYHILP